MEVKLLETIAYNTSRKESFQIVVSNNKTHFKTRFNPPLQLDKKKSYEIALVNLETYYSFPNITSNNNVFRYSADNGSTWFDVVFPEGSYELKDINEVIDEEMKSHHHNEKIVISANENTLNVILDIDDGFLVDFSGPNSIRSVLGFESKIYRGYNKSERTVNIMSINSILVNVDIISGSYVNGTLKPTIYSFFPNVSPGYKIVEAPKNLVYLPVVLDTIHTLETTITDQDGRLLNLRGETITFRFHIREK